MRSKATTGSLSYNWRYRLLYDVLEKVRSARNNCFAAVFLIYFLL
jgi:hypothetical protein